MTGNSVISVVIPVYNVSNYLKDCVDSVLSQTYNDLDIILVDDGSTDESGDICDEYRKNDSRVRVIHKKNGGLSSARNVGIDNALGEFITFIDSDDFIAASYVEFLYKSMNDHRSQICLCDFIRIEESRHPCDLKNREADSFNEYTCSPEEAIKNVYNDEHHGIDFVAWAKLYSTDLFKKTGIRYPEGKLHEDTFTTYKLFYEAEKLTYIDIPLYYYRVREGSIMTAQFNLRRLDMLEATREMCEFLRNKGNQELLTIVVTEHLHNVKLMLHLMKESRNVNADDMKLVCDDLRMDLEKYKNYISAKRYLYYYGLASMPGLFLRIR